MPKRTARGWLPRAGGVLLLLSLAIGVRAQSDEITVRDYCELTKVVMELSVLEWQDRLATAQAVGGEPKQVRERFESLGKQYSHYRSLLHGHFRIPFRTHLRYGADHKAEIRSFLQENAEIRQALESLKSRIDGLIQQLEAVMAAGRKGGSG